jgi:hypothetical protein
VLSAGNSGIKGCVDKNVADVHSAMTHACATRAYLLTLPQLRRDQSTVGKTSRLFGLGALGSRR